MSFRKNFTLDWVGLMPFCLIMLEIIIFKYSSLYVNNFLAFQVISFLPFLFKINSIFCNVTFQTHLNITYPLYRTRFATEPIDVSRTLGNVSIGKNAELEAASAWLLLFQLKQHSPRMARLSAKPLMGVVGVLSTLMAIVSSTGLLLLLDVTFVDMCTVMPFLSLTIGIDDTFLMLAAWHETSRGSGVFERIDRAMRHAAVSISITSLTDALAFFIGSFAPLPAVIYFCYYSCAAIIFIFAYCLTVFVAALSLQGLLEEKNLNSLTMKPVRDIRHMGPLKEKLTMCDIIFNMGSVEILTDETGQNNNDTKFKSPYDIQKSPQDIRMWYHVFFEDYYAPFISKSWVATLAFILFLTYTVLAYIGTQNVVVGFDVLREFEETPCSNGRNSTTFWFFSFEEYMRNLGFGDSWKDMQDDNESFMGNLHGFLVANDKFAYDVLSKNGSIQAFRLSTGLVNVKTDENINNCAHLMRDICDKHTEYGLSTYTPMWNIADQFEIMWPQTMQDLYISIVVMICVAILFIPQPLCSLVIASNIASVAMGVIGFMSWWNVNLDATSMITIAMSVGFSVDFAAHVSYAYMTEEVKRKPTANPAESRLRCILGTVGWPITQASFSVLLGVSSLYTVDSYVVQTCFKTVLLVIIFDSVTISQTSRLSGTMHALLFLPLVLMYAHKTYLFFSRKIVWPNQVSKAVPVDVQS
uniref:SSD domain-containing protein n=1 Tax=Heterorhabditis bacteriophora TaxID=37862 RepID=A0A1I7XF51_HETBA